MDLIFGSEGVGCNDLAIMEAVRREVGLDRILGEMNTGDVSPHLPTTEYKSEGGEKRYMSYSCEVVTSGVGSGYGKRGK